MRLLRFDSTGELSLTNDLIEDIPRYAILSHTWRLDGDEVTFEDLKNPFPERKAGYDKIRFCGEQAKKDGLQYFWVDTCCIDKSSSAELQEAISSMFEWYRKAVKCYVYLSDVSISELGNDRTTQSAFQKSRWFERGWTLQELLAPRVVEFYSQEGEFLGDKTALEQQIYKTTGIPVDALRGASLLEFSQEERLRWAEKRKTSRKEDKGYCLLGILDVSMYLSYGEGDNAFKRLKDEIGKRPMYNTPKPVCYMPFNKTSGFVGRSDELNAMKTKLLDRDDFPILALLGLGGVGKSRLALELAYRVKSERPQQSVLWIQAHTLLTFEEDMLQIGKKLGIPGIDDAKTDIKNLVKWRLQHQSDEKWLLVLDNADDEALWGRRSDTGQKEVSLVDHLPTTPNCTILVTTRSRLVATFLSEKVVDLQALSADEATEMFANRLGSLNLATDRMTIEMLSKRLTNLPLAIVQASSFINKTQCSLQDYLELLNQPEDDVIELLSKDFGDGLRHPIAHNPIATTWLISFQHIHERHPLAVVFLSSMACLHEKAIPLSLLPGANSKIKTVEAIGVLTGYSFIQKRTSSNGISDVEQLYDMHRLVQLAARSWLKMQNRLADEIRGCTVRLAENFPSRHRKYKYKSAWSMYLPHGQRLCESEGDFAERYRLLEQMGLCFVDDGKYDEAVQAHTTVVNWREKKFGTSDEQTLKAYNNLGEALNVKGDWLRAERYIQRALDGQKRFFGAEHPYTLISMNNLASTYLDQSKWTEAEELNIQVLEISKRILGPEHLNTLASMNDLALTYWKQGRLEQAEELNIEVLEISRRALGPEHPDTLTSTSNLASTYQNQGHLEQAQELNIQVLETRKRILGPEHPDTLSSMNNLASTYQNQGHFGQAQELNIQVLETRKRIFGPEHPDTLSSMNNLASTYRDQGRLEQAEELQVQASEISKRVLGPEHSNTLTSMSNLASIYWKQGRWTEAEELDIQVLETRKTILGPEHLDTLISMNNLATTYQNQGRWTKAEELQVQVLETSKRILGSEHPNTLTGMANLAHMYMTHQRKGDALTLMSSCANLRLKVLGFSHSHTKAAKDTLREWQADEIVEKEQTEQDTIHVPGSWID